LILNKLKKTIYRTGVVLFVLVSSLNVSFAVITVPTPNLFDPGRVSRELQGPLFQTPNAVSSLPRPETKPTPAQLQMQKIRFVLTQIILEGNTVFSAADLRPLYSASLNKTISLADLQTIADAITKKYRESGYILSRAILPPQSIKKGIVRIQIIEGFISNVTISGNPGKVKSLIQKYGEQIQQSKPLDLKVLEHYSLLANDLPGISVKAVLTPSKTMPAGADLNLVVDKQRGAAAVYYDNYGTRYLGPNETTVTGNLYSLFAPGDNNQARVVVSSRTNEMQFGELTHIQPIGTQGMTWTFDANYTQTRPQFTLSAFDIVGRSVQGYTDWVYPFMRTRAQNLFGHTLLSYQNVNSTILGGPFYQDRFRTMIIGGSYNLLDHWQGINTAALDFEHSFPFFGAHDHFYQSRPKGQTIYSKLNLSLSRLQGLGGRYSLYVAVHGQYTQNILLSTPQFGFGGPDYGRAYDPSEIVGDKGAAGKVEFRIDTSPERRFLQTVQYYIFYDAGIIWNLDKVDLPGRQSATSTGVGARFLFIPQLSGNLFIAKPLSRPVATMVLLGRNGTSSRIFFQLVLGS
jgi:hemolysin activation/secretion protein